VSLEEVFTNASKNTLLKLQGSGIFRSVNKETGYISFKHYQLSEDDERKYSNIIVNKDYLNSIKGQNGILIRIPNYYEVDLQVLDRIRKPKEYFEFECYYNAKMFNETEYQMYPYLLWFYEDTFYTIKIHYELGELMIDYPPKLKELLLFD